MQDQIDRIEERTRKIEQKIFNGMSDTLAKLEAKLPELMTVSEHERIEDIKMLQMQEMAKKRDRNVRLAGALMPLLTALAVWGLNQI